MVRHKLDSEVEGILQHHGVKGMKWDESKKEKKDGEESSTKSESDAKLVNDIVRGNYGNGEERKKKLGKRYQELQDMVNEQLSGKSSKTKDKSKDKSVKKKVALKKSELKNIKKKIKPKNKKRSDGLLQQMLDLTTDGVGKLFSKFR